MQAPQTESLAVSVSVPAGSVFLLSWSCLMFLSRISGVVLPMGFVFVDDKQSGYVNLVLYRQRKRGYVIHRALAACLTACVAVCLR